MPIEQVEPVEEDEVRRRDEAAADERLHVDQREKAERDLADESGRRSRGEG